MEIRGLRQLLRKGAEGIQCLGAQPGAEKTSTIRLGAQSGDAKTSTIRLGAQSGDAKTATIRLGAQQQKSGDTPTGTVRLATPQGPQPISTGAKFALKKDEAAPEAAPEQAAAPAPEAAAPAPAPEVQPAPVSVQQWDLDNDEDEVPGFAAACALVASLAAIGLVVIQVMELLKI